MTIFNRDIWLTVYGAAYVQASDGKSLERKDVAQRCHFEAVAAADAAVEAFKTWPLESVRNG